jgi:hypothetical protein
MQSGRKAILRGAITFLCVALAATNAVAAQIVVEAETFNNFYDYAADPISIYPVGTALVTLHGLDSEGEWVEYTMSVAAFGSYSFSMICWGDLGVTYTYNVYFTPVPGGDPQAITASFMGTGCFT